ncbi:MAG: fucose isomerase [Candidatus Latescibacteria bacterium]|nr:fucose isomerase [Candidatus Latescibacterota bacterium]
MQNMPEVKAGIVAVSRDCFLIDLSRNRRKRVVEECKKKNIPVIECQTIVENERDVLKALEELDSRNINALVIYLGNFGPEGPLSMLAERFDGPVMLVGAAEDAGDKLIDDRGDAYCGMLNASYNMALRWQRPYIPEYPVGLPGEIADKIADFIPTARVIIGLSGLKIFSFGPRPQDFLACNAPVKPLYDIGVEIMENSELDLYDLFREAEGDPEIKTIAQDMANELGQGNNYPDLLVKLAQYERALVKFYEENRGASQYAVFANKCWPAFEKYFGFVPCFINSRLAGRGIPVSCEVDIYGALSEYMVSASTELPATLLDINNTVPYDMIEDDKQIVGDYKPTDLFMGFHCGNTASSCMGSFSMGYQLIMKRLQEPDKEPDITRGNLDGTIRPGDVTIFRLQGTADTDLRSYVAQGEILDMNPRSFGGIGVFAIREMGRFYRHVLIGKQFPHHTAVGFKHAGKVLFNAVTMLGVGDISHNKPHGVYYPDENPYG